MRSSAIRPVFINAAEANLTCPAATFPGRR